MAALPMVDGTSAPVARPSPPSTDLGDVTVVRPGGVLDRRTLAGLDDAVAAAGAAVVIDLSDCALTGRRALSELGGRWRNGLAEVCLVCRRLSGRRLLARAEVRVPVFATVEDAVQARVLHDAGYGAGWS